MSDNKNFQLVSNEHFTVVGVPNRLTTKARKNYVPYLNVYNKFGLVGTLTYKDLRRLQKWLNRVQP